MMEPLKCDCICTLVRFPSCKTTLNSYVLFYFIFFFCNFFFFFFFFFFCCFCFVDCSMAVHLLHGFFICMMALAILLFRPDILRSSSLFFRCLGMAVLGDSLRKHAYSNILKILQTKTGKNSDKKF